MTEDLLSVEAVTRTYAMGGLFGRAHFDAVKDVSFALPDGKPEIFTVVGESGSAKLTSFTASKCARPNRPPIA